MIEFDFIVWSVAFITQVERKRRFQFGIRFFGCRGHRYEEGKAFECLVKVGELSSLRHLQLGRLVSKPTDILPGDRRSKLSDAEGS